MSRASRTYDKCESGERNNIRKKIILTETSLQLSTETTKIYVLDVNYYKTKGPRNDIEEYIQ